MASRTVRAHVLLTVVLVGLLLAPLAPGHTPVSVAAASASVTPNPAPNGGNVTITGSGATAGQAIHIFVGTIPLCDTVAQPDGTFTVSCTLPTSVYGNTNIGISGAGVQIVLPLTVLPPATNTPVPQGNPLTIDRVWTRDGSGHDKTTFAPGDDIQYTTVIRNTSDHPVAATFQYSAAGPVGALSGAQNPASTTIYSYQQSNATIPPGINGYYSPWTIPTSAQPGLYRVSITVCLPEGCVDKSGEFTLPGVLAVSITTYLLDSTATPTGILSSAPQDVASVGAGDGLEYRITVTNISTANATNVTVNDELPRGIFSVINTPTNADGVQYETCNKPGPGPSTLTCTLGTLTPDETATVSVKEGIETQNQNGKPSPPGDIVTRVSAQSVEQQAGSTVAATVTTAVVPLSGKDFDNFQNVATSCGLLPLGPLGTLAGIADTLREGTDRQQLTIAAADTMEGTMEYLVEKQATMSGLGTKVILQGFNLGKCIFALKNGYYIN